MSSKKVTPLGISSFHWWITFEQGEPYSMTVEELGDYRSDYVRCWNLITDRGWKKINKMWTSPDGLYKFNNVYSAYRAQMHWEEVTNKTVELPKVK